MKKKDHTFSIEIIRELDRKGYYVLVPALPGCFSQGRTIEEAKKNIAEAIKLHVQCLRKSGEVVPNIETFQTTIQVAA